MLSRYAVILAFPFISGCALLESVRPGAAAARAQRQQEAETAVSDTRAEEKLKARQERIKRIETALDAANDEADTQTVGLFEQVRSLATRYSAGPDSAEAVAKAVAEECSVGIAAAADPMTKAAVLETALEFDNYQFPSETEMRKKRLLTASLLRNKVIDSAISTVVQTRSRGKR